ncbi:Hibernation-associated plasma protein HP-20 [Heterocephalus glaber]|uniref:Hibernation-associated plasma protein HP-20 n=1 Tax=Heterocephalus glaber TaxID=10181 RepID=G5BPE5_HETGA|nr:Hibernation-associated plasma protein HP-20 [Heterocephalus glaber]
MLLLLHELAEKNAEIGIKASTRPPASHVYLLLFVTLTKVLAAKLRVDQYLESECGLHRSSAACSISDLGRSLGAKKHPPETAEGCVSPEEETFHQQVQTKGPGLGVLRREGTRRSSRPGPSCHRLLLSIWSPDGLSMSTRELGKGSLKFPSTGPPERMLAGTIMQSLMCGDWPYLCSWQMFSGIRSGAMGHQGRQHQGGFQDLRGLQDSQAHVDEHFREEMVLPLSTSFSLRILFLPGATGLPGTTEKCHCKERSAFAMKLSGKLPPASGPVLFTEALCNVQRGFEEATGVFTCREAGHHYFSFGVELRHCQVKVRLMRNHSRVLEKHQLSRDDYGDLSGAVILPLRQGDKVWLEAEVVIEELEQAHVFIYFSGFLTLS